MKQRPTCYYTINHLNFEIYSLVIHDYLFISLSICGVLQIGFWKVVKSPYFAISQKVFLAIVLVVSYLAILLKSNQLEEFNICALELGALQIDCYEKFKIVTLIKTIH